MPLYSYQAVDGRTGRERAGRVDAPNPEQAILKLKAAGLFPTRVDLETRHRPGAGRRGLGAWVRGRLRRESIHFTRQLAVLLHAGVPLVRALELIGRQDHPPAWQTVVASLADSVRGGSRFSDSLVQEPVVFDAQYVSIIRAGEASGRMAESLTRLADLQERTERLRSRVQAALAYPAVIATVAVGIVTALMIFVVPRFEAVFAGLLQGEALPALTRGVIATGRFVAANVAGLATSSVGIAGLAIAVGRTEGGRLVRDRLLLRIPQLGDLALKAAVARFTRTLGVLLSAGVPILAALRIAGATVGNACIARILSTVCARVEAGEPMSVPLTASGQFPSLMIGLIEVGEESGGLPEMLEQIANTYDQEVDRAVGAVTALLEPLLIVFMAVVVGTVVIALFLPIVRIIQSLG